jgi:hypothetical protein
MSNLSYTCRYCGESFVPPPEKPGYVDECLDCLHERTRPKIPSDFVSRFAARFPERQKAFAALRKQLLSLGIDESKVFEAMADALKKEGTPI